MRNFKFTAIIFFIIILSTQSVFSQIYGDYTNVEELIIKQGWGCSQPPKNRQSVRYLKNL